MPQRLYLGALGIKKEMNQKAGKRVLVVTEGFPRINQPWIDTYLEQLLKNAFRVAIYSDNKKPGKYHEKVDRLNLRQYVIEFDLDLMRALRRMIRAAFLNPKKVIEVGIKARKISGYLADRYGLNRKASFYKLLRFGLEDDEFAGIDIIHAHSEILAFEFLFLALIQNVPLVYTFHGLTPKGVNPLASDKRRALYGEVSLVFANTEFSRVQVKAIGCAVEKIVVSPQGLPLEEFAFAPISCPGKNEVLHILSVGRFHKDKGYRFALLAMKRLRRANVNLFYHIVGVGPERADMQRLIDRLGMLNRVAIYGSVGTEALHRLYRKAHLFVLPSVDNKCGELVETQGVVLQEAQASGCIPIATRVGGIPECLNHKQDAILVRDRSARSICDAVLYLLERPEEWSRYQANGRRNVEERFSADIIGAQMARILEEIAEVNEEQLRPQRF